MYTYKFRLYPTKEQEVLLAKHFGVNRFLYNYFLANRIDTYQFGGVSSSFYGDCKEVTYLKSREELAWLREVNSQSLQQTLKDLDGAYNKFFEGLAKFPNFKSKKNARQSFRVPQSIEIENNRLCIPKFKGGLKIKLHRPVEGKIRNCTVSRHSSGQYHVSIAVERVNTIPQTKTRKAVGVDVGVKDLAILSDGKRYGNPKYSRSLQQRKSLLQRRLKRKQLGSKNRGKLNRQIAKITLCATNQRTNHLHQVSHRVTKENQLVVTEDLAVANMVHNHKLAYALSDVSLGEFQRQLEYKSAWRGGQLEKVDRFYPSSKTCSACGWIHQGLKLEHRTWTCGQCQTHHDRDLNAARNILWYGLEKLGVERPDVKASGLPNYGRSLAKSLRSSGRLNEEARYFSAE